MRQEAGVRRRRRTHLLAAASILAVIVAVALILEILPSSGPKVTPASPKQTASDTVTPFGEAFARGIEAMRLGDAHTAALAFDEARAINPHIAEAHINLGFAFLVMERPREAATAFDRALSIDPQKTNAYYGLGVALDSAGDREGAMGAMRSYVHLTAEDDPFRRKALSALWEWEAAKKSEKQQQGSTRPKPEFEAVPAAGDESRLPSQQSNGSPKTKSEVLASKDAGNGNTPEPAPHKSDAEEKDKPESVAVNGPAASETPGPTPQQGYQGERAKSAVLAMQDMGSRNAPAPLPAIAETPELLTTPEGMISIVNVWASWCGPCRAELPSLEAFAAALDPARYRLIGLNIDKDRDFAREFIRDTGVSFGNFWDGEGAFARERFQVESYPQTLFLDSSGALLARVVGAREWSAEAAESTVAEMLAAGRQK